MGCSNTNVKDEVPNNKKLEENNLNLRTIFYGLFLHRKIKVDNDKYINYEIKGTKLSGISIVFAALFFLIHSFVYFTSFSIIYFIYLIIFCKRKRNINIKINI